MGLFLFFIYPKKNNCKTLRTRGFAASSELMGSPISGNANIILVEYSLNFRYKWKKNNLKLLSGGEYIKGYGVDLSNNLFGQLRYNYHFNSKNRLVSLYQLQYNKVLLLNRRQLLGLGIRHRLLEIDSDSTNKLNADLPLELCKKRNNSIRKPFR